MIKSITVGMIAMKTSVVQSGTKPKQVIKNITETSYFSFFFASVKICEVFLNLIEICRVLHN